MFIRTEKNMTRVSLHCVMYLAKVTTILPKLHILHFKTERKGMAVLTRNCHLVITVFFMNQPVPLEAVACLTFSSVFGLPALEASSSTM